MTQRAEWDVFALRIAHLSDLALWHNRLSRIGASGVLGRDDDDRRRVQGLRINLSKNNRVSLSFCLSCLDIPAVSRTF